jgi:tetratricopeptide (TPR) repeat protein
LPEDASISVLDPQVRADLHGLGQGLADAVGAHLAAAGLVIDEDPELALAHARYARARAPRVASVREAVGVAAYAAGYYAEALAELRAARRIGGDPGTLALIADCERALGRPERALSALSDPDFARLDADEAAEVILVVAGARRDLQQYEAALVTLSRAGIDPARPTTASGRIWYAYADILAGMGRLDEAKEWFARAATRDDATDTDAADRARTG